MTLICPACHSRDVKILFDMGRQPMSLVCLQDDPEQSSCLERHLIQLAICRNCSHVHNTMFDPSHLTYSAAGCRMWNNGELWKEHVDLVRSSASSIDVDLIVEVGAGDCEFLASLETSAARLAIDPCEAVYRAEELGLDYERAYFDPYRHIPKGVSRVMIVMRHLLEHMENPRDYIERIIRRVDELNIQAFLLIEVPCCQNALRRTRIEDWTYEHPQHFTVSSMHKLLRNCDVYRNEVITSYGGEVIVAMAIVEPKPKNQIDNIVSNYRQAEDTLDALFLWSESNLNDIAFWGGAGKSAMFINKLKPSSDCLVVDSDERKQGYFVPGTRIEIQSPEVLKTSPRKYIISTTSWRTEDIAREISRLGISCEKLYTFENGELTEVPLGN